MKFAQNNQNKANDSDDYEDEQDFKNQSDVNNNLQNQEERYYSEEEYENINDGSNNGINFIDDQRSNLNNFDNEEEYQEQDGPSKTGDDHEYFEEDEQSSKNKAYGDQEDQSNYKNQMLAEDGIEDESDEEMQRETNLNQ